MYLFSFFTLIVELKLQNRLVYIIFKQKNTQKKQNISKKNNKSKKKKEKIRASSTFVKLNYIKKSTQKTLKKNFYNNNIINLFAIDKEHTFYNNFANVLQLKFFNFIKIEF